MVVLQIIIGMTVLLFGRKLFWLFVAFSGFLVGAAFSQVLIPQFHPWIAVAVGIGVIGAVLAVVAQRIAFVLAGGLTGLYLVFLLVDVSGYGYIPPGFFLLGGILGAVAGFVFIDWAVIGFSVLVGAGVMVHALNLSAGMSTILFLVLSVIGTWIQFRQMDEAAETAHTA